MYYLLYDEKMWEFVDESKILQTYQMRFVIAHKLIAKFAFLHMHIVYHTFFYKLWKTLEIVRKVEPMLFVEFLDLKKKIIINITSTKNDFLCVCSVQWNTHLLKSYQNCIYSGTGKSICIAIHDSFISFLITYTSKKNPSWN